MIIIKDFKKPKLNSMLQTLYLKMFNIIKIIKLFKIKCKKHYIMHIKRITKNDKTKRLKKRTFILLLNLNYNIQFI